MSLIVEDGSGLANAESYGLVADADTYHAALKNADWTGALAVKEAAMRKGTRYIDANFNFSGTKRTRDQALQFPRYGAYQDNWLLSSTIIPEKLKQACYEAARISLTVDLSPVLDPIGGAKRIRVDVIELDYWQRGNATPVFQLINDLLLPLTGGVRGTSSRRVVRA